MAISERQILLCQSFRAAGDKKGICHKQSEGLLQYIEEEVLDRGLDC
ncbi:MAG: (2Fe-2S) ferredoxin domain-containing protein, partial [Candidatus Electrothrix sp. AX5]|nr:(2Fe-2S) ferredoxin domain-containing protein [Candidatus Electrothrix sp. AX5]